MRSIIRKLFPNKFVREQIQDLNQMASLFAEDLDKMTALLTGRTPNQIHPSLDGATSWSAYINIKMRLTEQLLKAQESIQKAREHKDWHSVRAYNLSQVARIAFEDVASGHYHVYRGRLGIDGEAYKRVCIIAVKELTKMGVWDTDSMRRLSEDLDERISEVG